MISKSEAKLSLAMAIIRSSANELTDVKSYADKLCSQMRKLKRRKRKKARSVRIGRCLTSLTVSRPEVRNGMLKYDANLFDAYSTLSALRKIPFLSETHLSHALRALLNSMQETLTSGEPEVASEHLATRALAMLDGDLVAAHRRTLRSVWMRFLTRHVLDASGPEPDSRERALKVVRHVARVRLVSGGCLLRSSVALASLRCLKMVANGLAEGPFVVSRWENSIHLVTLLRDLMGEDGAEGEGVARDCQRELFHITNDCLRLLTDTFPLFVHVMCQLNAAAANRTID